MAAQSKNLDDFFRRFHDRLRRPISKNEIENFNECMEERAAIMEYEGELSRQEAEHQAKIICLEQYQAGGNL